jgi:hypothetical protein
MEDLIDQFNTSFRLSTDELQILIENHKKLCRFIGEVSSEEEFVKSLHSKNVEYSQHITFNAEDLKEMILGEKLDIVLNVDYTRYPYQYCQLTMDLLYSFLLYLGYELDEDGNVL